MKGYRVYIPRERIVVATQHVRNDKNLTDLQDGELVNDLHSIDGQEGLDGRATYNSIKNTSGWTHDRRLTRSRCKEIDKQVIKTTLLQLKRLSTLSENLT